MDVAPVIALLASLALAASPTEEAQRAQLERVRAQVADQVHLTAFDLVDELVFGWMTEPVFEGPTAVVLAGVSVPVGLGTGLQALIENHLTEVLLHAPTAHVQLVHCPECTAIVVHSGPEGTIVSRGFDNPRVLDTLGGATGTHALFVDIEAEGAWLVLRARLTRLTPELPIVWSHTIATSASTPALLRQPDSLTSATAARQDYLDALQGRGPLSVPVRLVIRTYARPEDGSGTPPPPFLWLQTGVELSPTDARAWTASLVAGYSFIPQAYQGWMAQARVNRLLTGRTRSLTQPDLYGFLGAAVLNVWGPATAPFRQERLTADELLTDAALEDPRTAFGTVQVGLDLRFGNRVGAAAFLETLPDLANAPNLGDYVRVGWGWQSLGTEVTFWF